MLDAKAFANAVTAVTAVFYFVCAALSFLAPELIFNIGQSWVHTLNIEAVKSVYRPDLLTFLYGLLTIAAVTWVTTYAAIYLYNTWRK